jgi:hypothetical protein
MMADQIALISTGIPQPRHAAFGPRLRPQVAYSAAKNSAGAAVALPRRAIAKPQAFGANNGMCYGFPTPAWHICSLVGARSISFRATLRRLADN